MKNLNIILASGSPRRKQLLEQIGVIPTCCPVDIDESIRDNEIPLIYCKRLALEKAQTGFDLSNKNVPVLGSDTIVVLNGKTLGKPKDKDDAFSMLQTLSGNTHQVITAVAVVTKSNIKIVDSISDVTFVDLDDNEIQNYINTKEPMDKAGSYGIQGQAALWIKHISGSYSGIMGLPLFETGQLLREIT